MSVFSYIRTQRSEYETRSIPLFEGYDYSQYDTLNQLNHYWVDSYVDQASDDVIGDFPFDNVSKFRVLLEARATDFDTKHFEVEPIDSSREAKVSAMIATKALRKEMKDIKAGVFINDLCITRPKYGGVLAKHTSEGTFVTKWENLITDQSDIMAGIRIERHYMTPAELMAMSGSWENVKDAVRTAESFRDKDVSEAGGADTAQTQGDLIEIFELQGNFKLEVLKQAQSLMDDREYNEGEDDDITYVEAKIVACGADWVEGTDSAKEENGIILYAEEEETTHKYLARNPITGRALGEGVIESLFEHQKWHNFTKTEEMRMLAIAGKKLYWTDDPDILTNIFDEGVDHGTVLRVSSGKTLSELNQIPTGVPIYQNIRQEWADSADKQTSSFNAKIGEEAKSGTPFRAQYLQNVEASSQFEQYREEIGFLLQDIAEDWWLPSALKKASKEDKIYDMFTPQELFLIDEVITEQATIEEVVKRTLAGTAVSPEELDIIRQEQQSALAREGSKRTLTGIKEFIRKAGDKVIVHTTDESRNKAVRFESYSNAIAILAPEDPRRNALVEKIFDEIGISKEELEIYSQGNQFTTNPNPNIKTDQLAKANQTGAQLALSQS